MYRNHRLLLCVAIATTVGWSSSAIAVPTTIFKDDFQDEVNAVLSDNTSDSDPTIGPNDTGAWSLLENPALAIQVENDAIPGDAQWGRGTATGANNFLRVYRGGGTTSRGAPFARGWAPSDTEGRVVQLDMRVYQEDMVQPGVTNLTGMSVFFGTAYHSGNVGSGVNNFANAASVQLSLGGAGGVSFPKDQWVAISVAANYGAATELGVPAQNYSLSINGGTPTFTAFTNAATQVPEILIGLSETNEASNYLDDVQIRIMNPLLGVPGDYNGNDVVDSADYVLWRKDVTPLMNEVPGVTPVDTTDEDYLAWRERFGNSTPGSGSGLENPTSVPEPAAFILLGVGIGACWAGRRNRAKSRSLHQC